MEDDEYNSIHENLDSFNKEKINNAISILNKSKSLRVLQLIEFGVEVIQQFFIYSSDPSFKEDMKETLTKKEFKKFTLSLTEILYNFCPKNQEYQVKNLILLFQKDPLSTRGAVFYNKLRGVIANLIIQSEQGADIDTLFELAIVDRQAPKVGLILDNNYFEELLRKTDPRVDELLLTIISPLNSMCARLGGDELDRVVYRLLHSGRDEIINPLLQFYDSVFEEEELEINEFIRNSKNTSVVNKLISCFKEHYTPECRIDAVYTLTFLESESVLKFMISLFEQKNMLTKLIAAKYLIISEKEELVKRADSFLSSKSPESLISSGEFKGVSFSWYAEQILSEIAEFLNQKKKKTSLD